MLLPIVAFVCIGWYVIRFVSSHVRTRDIPIYVLVSVLFGLYIPFCIVILLPIDLASTARDRVCAGQEEECREPLFYLSRNALLGIWRGAYWTTFALTWVFIPLLQSYVSSGHRAMGKRIRQSLYENLRFQGIVLACCLGGLVYVILSSPDKTSVRDLKAMVIALGNSYGLCLEIYFLGVGLVNVPRRLWLQSSLESEMRELSKQAMGLWEARETAQEVAHDNAREVTRFHANSVTASRGIRDWIGDLYRKNAQAQQISGEGLSLPRGTIITEDGLAGLSRRVKRDTAQLNRAQEQWAELIRRAQIIRNVLDASSYDAYQRTASGRFQRLNYMWQKHMRSAVLKLLAFGLACLSVLILWSELFNRFTDPFLSFVGLIVRSLNGSYGLEEILSCGILMYMAWCTYTSLLRVRLFKAYALTRNSTDSASLLFFASYLCRMTVPLSYNFVTLLDRPASPSTFSDFLGANINLTDVGKEFNNWFPLFILIPVLSTSFNLYDRVLNMLGLSSAGWFLDENDGEDSRQDSLAIIEGRNLIDRELNGDGSPAATRARRNGRRPILPVTVDDRHSLDDTEDAETDGMGHRLWNAISTRWEDFTENGIPSGQDDRPGGQSKSLLDRIPWWQRRDVQ